MAVGTALDANAGACRNYSRLVIDCNGLPPLADSIPLLSEWVQHHRQLNTSTPRRWPRAPRRSSRPIHEALQTLLDQRQRERKKSLLVSLHSFTPS